MSRQKTRKTAIKRVNMTNPKGNRETKMMINSSARHHLKTKRSRVSKRRKPARQALSVKTAHDLKQVIVNL